MFPPETQNKDQQEVLVVDDTPASLKLLTGILTEQGYRVRPASSGRLALKSVAARVPDLILLDVKMPDMGGYEVCRCLKSEKHTRDIPVIFISAIGESKEIVKGFEVGGVDYIIKPFEVEEVLARVKTHLRLRELTESLEQKVNERTDELLKTNRRLRMEIAERELMERELAESRSYLDSILSSMKDLVFVFDMQGRFTSYYTAGSELYLSPKKFIGKKLSEIMPSGIVRLFNRAFEKCNKGQTAEFEYQLEIGGKTEWYAAKLSPIINDGKSTGAVAVVRNITEAKQVKEKAEHLSLILQSIRNVNQLIVREKDRKKLIKAACENLIETRGFFSAWLVLLDKKGNIEEAAEAGLGKNFVPLLEQVQQGRFPKCMQKALEQHEITMIGNPEAECADCPLPKKYRKRGAMIARLEYEGKIYGLLNVSVPGKYIRSKEEQDLFRELADDVAFALRNFEFDEERKSIDNALRESARWFRAVIEASKDAKIAINPKGLITLFNPAAEKMFGYQAKEMTGQPLDLLMPEEFREKHRQYVKGYFTSRKPDAAIGKTVELFALRKDGNLFPIELSLSAGKASGQKFILAVIRDISERKQAEKDRRNLEAQLRQAQKIESIGQLAGGMAHDFNNMLTPIIGYADLALLSLDEKSPIYLGIKEILKAAKRASNLTKQLLAFGRKQVLNLKVVNINSVILDFREMIVRLIEENVTLNTTMEPDLWNVRADYDQVQQILMNLSINARDAMPGGGTLTISTANTVVDAKYVMQHTDIQQGEYVLLTISDDGCGMDEYTISHIFEPFFTTKGLGKGTGLGLSTVYGIVKQHQGAIEVESGPGRGTTFKIYLPREKMDKKVVSEEKELLKSPVGTETIMVVEDEEMVGEAIKIMLSSAGYNVISVQNGKEAMDQLKGTVDAIDLIITDVILPETNGMELRKKAVAERPEIKVLFISGYIDDVAVQQGIFEEGVHFLQKPFSRTSLLEKVREVLEA